MPVFVIFTLLLPYLLWALEPVASTQIMGGSRWPRCVFQYTDNCGHIIVCEEKSLLLTFHFCLLDLKKQSWNVFKGSSRNVFYDARWRVLHLHQYAHQEIIRTRCHSPTHSLVVHLWFSGVAKRELGGGMCSSTVRLYPQVPPLKISEMKIYTKTEKMIMTVAVFLKYDLVLWVVNVLCIHVLYTLVKYWCLTIKSTPATPLSWLLNSGIDEWNAYEFFLDFEDMQAQYNKLHGHTYSIFDVYFSVNILISLNPMPAQCQTNQAFP